MPHTGARDCAMMAFGRVRRARPDDGALTRTDVACE
jgi:hypothetical protein